VKVAHGLALDRASVDGNVSKICKKFLGAVLTLYQLEKFWGVVDKLNENKARVQTRTEQTIQG
jgi:hypothetical protein